MANDRAARNPEFERLIRLQTEAFARSTPYHSLELGDGRVIPGLIPVEALRERLDAYGLPEDLRGLRVLDIGAASGWNSFECERRGAEVTAIDYVEYEELTFVKRVRRSKIEYIIIDLDELTPERFGTFDYVLFFGVLYHLRHPLLGLERVCAVTRGQALIESFVIDHERSRERCHMEFYETTELGGQIDNWFGPTTECLMALTRAAGFAQAEFLYAHSRRCGLRADRLWPKSETKQGSAPFLCSAVNNRHHDAVFQQGKDEYLILSFLYEAELAIADIFVEVDRLGVPALFLAHHDAGFWQVNCKLPPGLAAGAHEVRLRVRSAPFSDAVAIQVLPLGADRRFALQRFVEEPNAFPAPVILRCENTADSTRFFQGLRNEKLIVQFTSDELRLDLSRVQLSLNRQPFPLLLVDRPRPGVWQANANLRDLAPGGYELRLRTSAGAWSEPLTIEVRNAFGARED